MKNWSKGNLLAAGVALFAIVSTVFALNPTVFSDLKATNIQVTTLYDNASTPTARLVPGSTNTMTGNLTVSGNLTGSGTSYFLIAQSTAPRDSSSAIGITPAREGQLVYNTTDKELCFSTGTTRFTFVKISTPSAACAH